MAAAARIAFAVGCAAVVALETIAVVGWQKAQVSPAPAMAANIEKTAPARRGEVDIAARAMSDPLPVPAAPRIDMAAAQQRLAQQRAEQRYYDDLRRRVRWVSTRIGNETLTTPDPESRMLLVKSAAHHAGLQEVGLSFKDVYGIISAETSWIPRAGASKDGTPNLGIAQFEPGTARLLGMRDPNDPVESVHVAALHMKEAALWSQERIAGLKLDAQERAARLRDGVSIYYNLSSRGRAAWNGMNTRKLPRETQLHILNARAGAMQADLLEAQLRLRALRLAPAEAVATSALQESRAN